tara:strand:- start:6053 stop:8023 length:1971 start_codon:yes stop_codon:yes gene_type:complete
MKNFILLYACLLLFLSLGCAQNSIETSPEKLHWFIPDGMRADPVVFDVFSWAEEGRLPNIKRLMDQGSYGYSIPTFPTHTPTNFATLLTGAYPQSHGIADGPMHIEGFPLAKPSAAGFSSSARKLPAVWSIFEELEKEVVLLSVPGSTPPEFKRDGKVIRGRWGGWGADFHSLIFESASEQEGRLGRGKKLFFLGYDLTRFMEREFYQSWGEQMEGFSPSLDYTFDVHGQPLFVKIVDSTNDGQVNYDRFTYSLDRDTLTGDLVQGEWGEWLGASLVWQEREIDSHIRLGVIKLEEDGFFRVRVLVDNLNSFITSPQSVSSELGGKVGPMVDFVDNFPPQLIYYDEDKDTFLDEAGMSFDWHQRAVEALYDLYDPDVMIHDIYSPNQMLTSRWWMGYIDPSSSRYGEVGEDEREKLWEEVKDMYVELDDIVGEALKHADKDTLFVLSSDHGAAPLDVWVRLNNFFAEKGWLVYSFDEKSGEPTIDYEQSTVVYLKMDSVYINPEGLGPTWVRGEGEKYEQLRREVREVLEGLEYDGQKVVSGVFDWEDVGEFLDLPSDRVGDLVVANSAGFGWNEELTTDERVFDVPLKTGYKQAIFAEQTEAMWTPFVIAGPGIRKGFKLSQPIQHVDQLPTILTVMEVQVPDYVEGQTLNEILV